MKIYLYVKKHKLTGMKYFGKTTKLDPYTYNGSGKYWRRHIKYHGIKHVETISVWEFTDTEACVAFAINFSKENNIVGSSEWANLKPENGLDGGSPKTGRELSANHRKKICDALKNRVFSEQHKMRLSEALRGKQKSVSHCARLSVAKKGKPVPHLQTRENRQKLAQSLLGHEVSAETRAKIASGRNGADNPFHGKTHNAETRAIMSMKAKEQARGRFWIVNSEGTRKACYSLDDPRLTSGQYRRGAVWKD